MPMPQLQVFSINWVTGALIKLLQRCRCLLGSLLFAIKLKPGAGGTLHHSTAFADQPPVINRLCGHPIGQPQTL